MFWTFFPLMITKQSFLKTLQKYPLMVIRSCLISTFPNFWKVLIFRRYPFLLLQHSKNNGPLLQSVFFFKFDVVGCLLVLIVQVLLFIPFFLSYQPMMKNCFQNCNLNIIHDVFCNGHIFSTFLTS